MLGAFRPARRNKLFLHFGSMARQMGWKVYQNTAGHLVTKGNLGGSAMAEQEKQGHFDGDCL